MHWLTQTIKHCVGRCLERQGLLERGAEDSCLAAHEDPELMAQLHGNSVTYRMALVPNEGRKVFTLQTFPAREKEMFEDVGKVAVFSLAGRAAKALDNCSCVVLTTYILALDEWDKLERLCWYIARPAVLEKRLSLTPARQITLSTDYIVS